MHELDHDSWSTNHGAPQKQTEILNAKITSDRMQLEVGYINYMCYYIEIKSGWQSNGKSVKRQICRLTVYQSNGKNFLINGKKIKNTVKRQKNKFQGNGKKNKLSETANFSRNYYFWRNKKLFRKLLDLKETMSDHNVRGVVN